MKELKNLKIKLLEKLSNEESFISEMERKANFVRVFVSEMERKANFFLSF